MTDKTIRRKAKNLLERKETEYAGEIQSLMKTPSGRSFIYRQLERAGIGQNPYTSDPNLTNFNCGKMNPGLELLNDVLTHSPQGYLTMLKEAEYERQYIDGELAGADTDNPQRDFNFGNPTELPGGDIYADD